MVINYTFCTSSSSSVVVVVIRRRAVEAIPPFLPSHSLRVPSPAIGIRPPSSTGILQRTSSHMLETLHALQRGSTHVLESLSEQNATTKQGSEIYALMADIWAFVEAHKELLNKQLKRSPQLQDVLYILDEPSIGLHQIDNNKLINSLKKLRDNGRTTR